MRPLLVLPLLVVPVAVACALPAGEPGGSPATIATATAKAAEEEVRTPPAYEATPADIELDDDAPAEVDADESFAPRGTFASLTALCDAQRALVRPHLAAVAKERAERGEADAPAARCEVSKTALANVDVKLRAPFLDVRAIDIETGNATETHLVVRTADGWQALAHASVTSFYDDPGCFSIARDSGISSVHVEGDVTPALVVVEGSARGASMEEADEPDDRGIVTTKTWDDVTSHVVGCHLEDGGLTCGAPAVLEVRHVPNSTEDGRRVSVLFRTTYTVGEAGDVRVQDRVADELAD